MDLPDEDALRWIVKTYAGLRAAHGEAFDAPALLQPTGAFFPDEFQPDAPGVARLLTRMIGYGPTADDLPLELAFLAPEVDAASGGCGSSACGSRGGGSAGIRDVEDTGAGYRVFIAAADVGNADVLAASLARSVGALVLHEAGERVSPEKSELAAIASGFGVLLANGAAVWAKSCGGLRVAQATVLSPEEIGVALALFVCIHGTPRGEVRAHLGTTQREALELASDWVDSNPWLAEQLRDRPASLQSGAFEVEPVRGAFGRWLHQRRLGQAMRAPRAVPAAPVSAERRRHLEEARALVDEAMNEGASEAEA
jgi:hypothetical protein